MLRHSIFFLALSALAGFATASVDDERVRMWIASALDGEPAATNTKAVETLSISRSSAASFNAWTKLKECRDAGNSLDLNLASAEHYLFIRAFAAERGEEDIEALPKFYGNVKEKLGPAAQLLKTSQQPVSPPDPGVVKWGEMGVKAGLRDFAVNTGKTPAPKVGAYQQFKLALQGYYDNYERDTHNPVCRVVQ